MISATWKLVAQTPDHIIGSYGPSVITQWLREITPAGITERNHIMRRLAQENPGGIITLTVVGLEVPAPTGEARRAYSGSVLDPNNHVTATAVVHTGTGLRAASVRSVIIGINALVPPAVPTKICATVEEGARWLQSRPVGKALELDAFLHQLREVMQPTATGGSGRP